MMNKAFQRHYSDDLLVAYLDGELSPFRHKSVHKHLRACWQCRARLDELEQQILAVTKLVERDLFPGPQRIAEARANFWARAGAVTESRVPRTGTRFQWVPLRPVWVLGSLLILLGVAWIWLRPRDTLPPQAVMARVKHAESALLQGAVHQQFRVVAVQVRPIQRRRESRLDVWYEPDRDRFTSRLQDDSGKLRHALWRPAPGREYVYNPAKSASAILAANGLRERISMDWFLRDGLTLEDLEHNLMKWLESRRWQPVSLASDLAVLVDDQGAVLGMGHSTAEDGGRGLRLFLRKSRGPVMVEFTIDVDRHTYRPGLQRIRYETSGSVLELQLIPHQWVPVLTAANFEPDASLLKPAPLPLTWPPKPKPVTPILSRGLSAALDTKAREIEALYALHRVRACLGEPVEVVRGTDGTLLVRGVTGTPQRKQEVIDAVAELGGSVRLETDIKSTEEALREVGRENLNLTTPGPRTTQTSISKELEKYFASEGPLAARAAERFSEDAVSLSEDLMTEAWALRQLAERFGSGQDRHLSPKSRHLLEAMCLDHLNDLRAKAAKTRQFVEPILSAISGFSAATRAASGVQASKAPWDSALLPVFDCTRAIHDGMLALFSRAKGSQGTGALIRGVLASFPELDTRLQGAAEKVPLSLSGRTEVIRNEGGNAKQ